MQCLLVSVQSQIRPYKDLTSGWTDVEIVWSIAVASETVDYVRLEKHGEHTIISKLEEQSDISPKIQNKTLQVSTCK